MSQHPDYQFEIFVCIVRNVPLTVKIRYFEFTVNFKTLYNFYTHLFIFIFFFFTCGILK